MTVDTFEAEAKKWTEEAKDGRWKRPYTELTYQPMQEVLSYLRANGFKTYIVTGGGQDFVRVYSERVYGIPPEQVVGSAGGTKYSYDQDGKPILTKEPKLLLNDNDAGKPEGIHLMIGRRPIAAFGNSTGDQPDAGIHRGRRRPAAENARASRRRQARIRLWAGPGSSRHQSGHLHPGSLRRGEEGRLGRHQHEERLETHFRVRQRPAKQPVTGLSGGIDRMSLIRHLLERPRSLSRDAKYTVLNGVAYMAVGTLLIVWPGVTQTVFRDSAFAGHEEALMRVIGLTVAVIGWLYIFGGRSGARQFVAASVVDRLVFVPLVLIPLAIAGVFPHLFITFALLDTSLAIGAWALLARE